MALNEITSPETTVLTLTFSLTDTIWLKRDNWHKTTNKSGKYHLIWSRLKLRVVAHMKCVFIISVVLARCFWSFSKCFRVCVCAFFFRADLNFCSHSNEFHSENFAGFVLWIENFQFAIFWCVCIKLYSYVRMDLMFRMPCAEYLSQFERRVFSPNHSFINNTFYLAFYGTI